MRNVTIERMIVAIVAITAIVLTMTSYRGEAAQTAELTLYHVIEPEEDREVIYESEYDRVVALIEEAAEIEGIDPKLAVAIARLETGNFQSELFLSGHNFGGLLGAKGYYTYETEPDGLVAYMECLKWYRDNGLDTVDKMADTYCPGGTWADRVKKIMKEL